VLRNSECQCCFLCVSCWQHGGSRQLLAENKVVAHKGKDVKCCKHAAKAKQFPLSITTLLAMIVEDVTCAELVVPLLLSLINPPSEIRKTSRNYKGLSDQALVSSLFSLRLCRDFVHVSRTLRLGTGRQFRALGPAYSPRLEAGGSKLYLSPLFLCRKGSHGSILMRVSDVRTMGGWY
jgi:hypothetical protein